MGKNIARLYSAELEGIDAKIIEVEADVNVGLHAFNIVGLADKSLNEAKERVNSALKNSGVKPPNRENRKITINLAPADVKKNGSHYDLAIALGYLLATNQIKKFDTANKIFLGELALDGRLRPVSGALNIAQRAAAEGFLFLFLPRENANEASVIEGITVIPVETLFETIEILFERRVPKLIANSATIKSVESSQDFAEICGQENAKRALVIAAAARHNILLIGPPGVGKSFLAHAMRGILPALEKEEAIEVTKIWSAAGLSPNGLVQECPFRAPHQTSSLGALIGGGQNPRPGEISLAHRGILFLDELPEFQRNAIEALRQPLESGIIQVARAQKNLVLPARFTLVAAMNPCPCGYFGDKEKECKCSAYDVIKYKKKISGPLLDRIDLQVRIERVDMEDLRKNNDSKKINHSIRTIVERTRNIQKRRYVDMGTTSTRTNSEVSSQAIQRAARFDRTAELFLGTLSKANLSPRGYYRLIKVARTIADLEEKERVTGEHLAEAFGYRLKEI
jgi:magnesium chelatase family protein